VTASDEDAHQGACSFKARLQILGVIREDVGTGKDYKQAATDDFKRAAVRFGIAHELYAYEQNWVALDGDGRFAKPLEDPAVAYARRYSGASVQASAPPPIAGARADAATATPASEGGEERCPKCSGEVWDNRYTKRNPMAPDFKCRDRACDGVRWPAKGESGERAEPVRVGTGPFAEGEEGLRF
jgi:hypothetical protein